MINLKQLFGQNGHKQKERIADVAVCKAKHHYHVKMLEIQEQAKIIKKATEEITKIVDTTTRIAVATGGKKRGLR